MYKTFRNNVLRRTIEVQLNINLSLNKCKYEYCSKVLKILDVNNQISFKWYLLNTFKQNWRWNGW